MRFLWFRRLSWPKRIAVTGGGGFLLLVVLVLVVYWRTSVPQPSRISVEQATVVQFSNGKVMGTIGTNRVLLSSLDDVSLDAQHAVLAAEDRDFYSEPGISPKGIARALFSNIKAGGTTQGGSTITQQYAKNAFLTQKRTYSRKFKEVFIAIKMSRTIPKDRILLDYLNTIYFGRGAYGIEAASHTYFGVAAKDLTVAQAAVLASSIRSPAGYDPAKHPQAAKDRWAYVLKGMHDKTWLSDAQYLAQKYPDVQDTKKSKTSFAGPLDYVKDQVIAELGTHGITEDQVAAGGLTVRTTLNQSDQAAAEAAMNAKIPEPTGDNPSVGALVSVNAKTGGVLAYYGGRDAGGFDYANSRIEPGSSMKPYVLAAALKDGKSLRTRYSGANHQDICGQKNVKNDSGESFGSVDLSYALAHSINTVYFRLACDVGPDKVQAMAHDAGIPADDKLDGEGRLSAQIALGSGGYEVKPIDQAAGYSTFADGGKQKPAHFLLQVTDEQGNDRVKLKVSSTQAMDESIAADTVSAMEQVVRSGTGRNAQLSVSNPVAGKTGTTSNKTNAWFVGITPQISTAVWIGHKLGGTTGGVYGGTVPAGIFAAYMNHAMQGQDDIPFPGKPDSSPVTSPQTAAPTTTPSSSATTPPPVVPTNVPTTLPTVAPSTEPTTSPEPPAASDSASPAASP